jgi:TRAP-type mannitol/chloroaromatic compound transport system permease small subunit
MQALLAFAAIIDRISTGFARVAAVLVFLSCTISAGNALSRYAFDISSNAWLEIQWQMFAGIFLLGSAHVLKLNEHVRVDMLYSVYSPRVKIWVDIFGFFVFFFPAVALMIWLSVPWFETSYFQGEMSSNAGGLPVWPVKALLPLGFAMLMLQGVAELFKRIAALHGDITLDTEYEAPLQ